MVHLGCIERKWQIIRFTATPNPERPNACGHQGHARYVIADSGIAYRPQATWFENIVWAEAEAPFRFAAELAVTDFSHTSSRCVFILREVDSDLEFFVSANVLANILTAAQPFRRLAMGQGADRKLHLSGEFEFVNRSGMLFVIPSEPDGV
jgi:hypothetical protein